MPRIDHNETFDEHGRVVSVEVVEVPDPEPTPDERIAQLEQQVAQLSGAMDAVAKAPSFDAAKAEIATRIDTGVIEVPALPEEEIAR